MKRFVVIVAGAAALAGCGWTPGMRDRAEIVAEPSPCTAKRFDVYFAENEARLTSAALQAIGLTATQLQGCDIKRVQVVGLASATGGVASNLNLSEQRAIAVAEALQAAGWPAPAFEVGAVGDAGATTAAGTNEPLRRRTEVLVEAAPKARERR
ncbi:OmpA family protein [Brevundimonas sp. M20]|uniref:OmpA family protein n=1 Tax=Brevundimonas sp. M20 TaxID=2591463 RepID=UPI0011477CE1|nr:OmpA family protein [Brevundimonas sp. M20]QDH72099.1 OmpA family protein [Brevundimonas sp. M20]